MVLALIKSADFVWPSRLDGFVQKAFDCTTAELDVVRRLREDETIQGIATLCIISP